MLINEKLVNAVVERVKQKLNTNYSPEAMKLRRLEQDLRSLRSQVAQLKQKIQELEDK